MSSFHSNSGRLFLSTLTFCILSGIPLYAQNDSSVEYITMVSPSQEKVVIDKKPPLQFRLDPSLAETPLFIMLDGSDITALVTRSNGFIDYHPLMFLNSGQHTVSIIYLSAQGEEKRQDFTFALRHTEHFEEATTNLALSPVYEGVIHKSAGLPIPNSKIEANLGVSTELKEGRWRTSFDTNLRYLDQSLSLTSSQRRGVDLANYLLNVDYTSDQAAMKASVGDIVIDESPTTVSGIGRRGAKVNYQRDGITVGAFSANSRQVSGFSGGTGLEATPEDHIYGVSLAKNFVTYNTTVKALYLTGGQNGDGNSTVSSIPTTPRTGDTLALIVGTKLLDNKLNVDGEFDLSRYDPDTTDTYNKEVDRAYKLRVGGSSGQFAYDALYEYLGSRYRVIGNDGLPRDKEGITLQSRYFQSVHSVDVTVSDYMNNVSNNPLYATIATRQGSVGYQYSGISSLPLSLRYEKNSLTSSKEPTPDSILDTGTDALSLSANYLLEAWNIGTTAKFSRQNDRTVFNNDSTAITYMITPTYFSNAFSVTPGFMFNRALSPLGRTDTSSASLQLFGNDTVFRKKITYALSSIYTKTKNSIGTYDQDSFSSEARLAYVLEHKREWLKDPSIGIRGLYTKLNNNITDQNSEMTALLFFVSLPVNYTF